MWPRTLHALVLLASMHADLTAELPQGRHARRTLPAGARQHLPQRWQHSNDLLALESKWLLVVAG